MKLLQIILSLGWIMLCGLLWGCSGTDIPNGVDDTDDPQIGENGSPDSNGVAFQDGQVLGRVSRGWPQSGVTLYVFDSRRLLLATTTTEASGHFSFAKSTLVWAAQTPVYPLVIWTASNPGLATMIAQSGNSASIQAEINPFTTAAWRALAQNSADWDHLGEALLTAKLERNANGFLLKDTQGKKLEVPPLLFQGATTTSLALAFAQSGQQITNQVLGGAWAQTASAWWGQPAWSEAPLPYPETQVLDAFLVGLGKRGSLEQVIAQAIHAPESSGRLLETSEFVYQMLALMTFDPAIQLPLTWLGSDLVALQQAQGALTVTAGQYSAFFLTDLLLPPPSNAQGSERPLNCQGLAPDFPELTWAQLPPLWQQQTFNKNEVLTQGIGQVLQAVQTAQPQSFVGDNNHAWETVTGLAAMALTNEVNRVFVQEKLPLRWLPLFVDALGPSLAQTIQQSASLGERDTLERAGPNVLSTAENLGKLLQKGLEKLPLPASGSQAEIQTQIVQGARFASWLKSQVQGLDLSLAKNGVPLDKETQIRCVIEGLGPQ